MGGGGRPSESRAGEAATGPLAEGGTCVRAMGPFPRPAGPLARVAWFKLVRSYARSYRMGPGRRRRIQVGVLTARATLRGEAGGGPTGGTDSDGAPTDPGAMGY